MKPNRRQSGLTLTEMIVVIGIIALLGALAAPATKLFFKSFESESGVRAMISSALASARAIAAKEQRYAGIRFQLDDPLNPLDASQYIIFIVQDPNLTGTWGFGFRAVEGLEPIKLPDSLGVMDFTVVPDRNHVNPINPTVQIRLDDPLAGGDTRIDDRIELVDTTAFSIVFSPGGKLVMHGVRVRNRDAMPKLVPPGIMLDNSNDDIFNTVARVTDPVNPHGMFIQDDYYEGTIPDYGLGPEPSRSRFIIYETEKFNQTYQAGQAYSGYLYSVIDKVIYPNPYSGTIIPAN